MKAIFSRIGQLFSSASKAQAPAVSFGEGAQIATGVTFEGCLANIVIGKRVVISGICPECASKMQHHEKR